MSNFEAMKFEPPRSLWPPGPWDDEPMERIDLTTQAGYAGLLHRGPMGAWCGYVGVPEGHPLYGKQYSECLLGCPPDAPKCPRIDDPPQGEGQLLASLEKSALDLRRWLEERGGKSWSCYPHPTPGALLRVHGGITYADSCHGRICHPGEARVWWFGFDTAHAWDDIPGMEATRLLMRERALLEHDEEGIRIWSKLPTDRDDSTYKDVAFVTEQVEKLASQLLQIEQKGLATYMEEAKGA